MVRSLAALFTAVLATVLSLPAEAQWKWKDKSGSVQYSDLPPPLGTPEQDIIARPGSQRSRTAGANAPGSPMPTAAAGPSAAASPASPSSAASANALAPRTVDPELEARRKKQEADQAAKAKAEEQRLAAARAENCSRARAQVQTLDSGIRLARANEKGEREILDDKQRGEEMKRAKDVVASDCK